MVAVFGQRSLRAVTFLRFLENTPGWLARVLLLFCLDGMCLLHSLPTGLQVTQPSSSVAALCLSVSTALLSPHPAPHHHAKHSTTHKVCSSGPRPTNSTRGAVTLFWGKFQTLFSFKLYFCFTEYNFLTQVFTLAITNGQPNTFMLLQTQGIIFCASAY